MLEKFSFIRFVIEDENGSPYSTGVVKTEEEYLELKSALPAGHNIKGQSIYDLI